MTTTVKRLDYLDMAKGIGMVLVLMGHLQGDRIFELSPYFHPMCVFIFSFHMPLFFLISGILMRIKEDSSSKSLSIKEHITKRFKGIMIPYLWFSLCYFSVVVFALIKGTIAVNTLLVNLWYIISCYGMNVLWFLPALFFGEILFIIIKQNFSGRKFYGIILISSTICYVLAYILTTLSYDTAILMRLHELAIVILRPVLVCGWITAGYTLHGFFSSKTSKNIIVRTLRFADNSISSENTEKNVLFKCRFMYILMGIAMLALCAILSFVNNGVDFRSLVLRNAFFYILCSLLGSYGLISICKGLPKIKLLCFWGTGSLIFMAVHNSETVLFYALKAAMFVNQYLTHARGYICYLIILGIILIYTSLMIILITKYLPFMLGKPFTFKKTAKAAEKED